MRRHWPSDRDDRERSRLRHGDFLGESLFVNNPWRTVSQESIFSWPYSLDNDGTRRGWMVTRPLPTVPGYAVPLADGALEDCSDRELDALATQLAMGRPGDPVMVDMGTNTGVAAPAVIVGSREVELEDGTRLAWDPPHVDSGRSLLEPVTPIELHGVELILGHLQRLVESGKLTELEQQQVMAMADMIRTRQRRTEPGRSPRWKMIAAVLGAAAWVATVVPPAANEIADLAERIGWLSMAEEIRVNCEPAP